MLPNDLSKMEYFKIHGDRKGSLKQPFKLVYNPDQHGIAKGDGDDGKPVCQVEMEVFYKDHGFQKLREVVDKSEIIEDHFNENEDSIE